MTILTSEYRTVPLAQLHESTTNPRRHVVAYDESGITLHCADVLEGLKRIPDESVQCVVTSPPYWGLRDYKISPQIWGGNPTCTHEWGQDLLKVSGGGHPGSKERWQHRGRGVNGHPVAQAGNFCVCGAWRGSLGLEPTPDLYIHNLVVALRQVRKVMRRDATLWLNLGDSYVGGGRGGEVHAGDKQMSNKGSLGLSPTGKVLGLKPKDLLGMPWRVAFALQADGWWLRADIIWSKLNPMPESVTDRPTRAHEYLFLLTKSQRYFYDAKAIDEPASDGTHLRVSQASVQHQTVGDEQQMYAEEFPGRKRRDRKPVEIMQALAKRLHRAGPNSRMFKDRDPAHEANGDKNRRTPEYQLPGVTPKSLMNSRGDGVKNNPDFAANCSMPVLTRNKRTVWTIATQPYPEAHFATFPEALVEPCILAGSRPGEIVLDPFAGSGTTLVVAKRLGRNAVGIELSPAYCELAARRIQDTMGSLF